MSDSQTLRPSQRLRAIAAGGCDVKLDQMFAINLLREIRLLEGDFSEVQKGVEADLTAKASAAAHQVAAPLLQMSEDRLNAARRHLNHATIYMCGGFGWFLASGLFWWFA